MELHFPAWELDIDKHMVIHLAESVKVRGPRGQQPYGRTSDSGTDVAMEVPEQPA